MRVVALLLLAWLMIGFPVAMIVLSLRWMAVRRRNGYKTSYPALIGFALFLPFGLVLAPVKWLWDRRRTPGS